MSEIKLLKCPFCGGEAEIVGSAYKRILCKGCEIEIFITEETVKKWNTRKPMQNIVERLEEQAEECRKYWQEFDDEDSFGGMNAYCDAVKIVKEEGGIDGSNL